MTREEKRLFWNQRITAYRESGLNVAQWCRLHHLSLHTMRYWISRQQHQPYQTADVQWLLLGDEEPMDATRSLEAVAEQQEIRIQIGNASVIIGREFTDEALGRVLKALKAYA